MEKQLWTRPELKVTEKWNLYFFLSLINVLCNHCELCVYVVAITQTNGDFFARGLEIQYQCSVRVCRRRRAWPAGSIEERPLFMDEQRPLMLSRNGKQDHFSTGMLRV